MAVLPLWLLYTSRKLLTSEYESLMMSYKKAE